MSPFANQSKTDIIKPMYLQNYLKSRILTAFLAGALILVIAPAKSSAQNQEKELFLVAQKAFEDGFYDVAIRYIDQLLQQHPNTEKKIQANLLLGQCYFFKSQYLKAYDTFQPLLEHSELKDATLFWLGETYLKGADYKQAEKHYQQLIKLYPKSIYTPQAYYSLGWVYFEQADYKQAKEIFQQLILHSPSHQLTEDAAFKSGECDYNLKDYEGTIVYFKEYIERFPQSTRHAEALFYIADSYYYLKDYVSAVDQYTKVADEAYNTKLTLMAQVSSGWSYLKMKKYRLSEQSFNDALETSKEKGVFSDDVFFGLANLYTEMQDLKKSVDAYTQLIENFPKSKRIAEAYLGKANIFYLQKKYPQAILAYQAVIDNFQDDKSNQEIVGKAYFGLAWSYLKDGNIDSSIKSFKTIQTKTANKTVKISALTQIGDAYQDIEQYQKALDVYDQILNDFPDSLYTDYVQYRQGIALLKMGNIDAATMSFQSLQANFPDSNYLQDTKYYLAVANLKKENWKATKELINEFIEQLPENSEFLEEAHYILALSQFNLKEFEEAILTNQSILKNYPEQSTMVKNAEFNLAKCYFELGDVKEALKKFKLLINKYPKSEISEDALIWLGDYYLESAEYDIAIEYYRQLIKSFPGSAQKESIYYELGQAYQAKEELDKAVSYFRKIDQNKNKELYAKARLAITDIFSRNLDTAEAIKAYENIILSSPEFKRDALFKIAQYYKSSKNYPKAVEAYRQALQADPGLSKIKKAELQFQIADTLELSKDIDLAIEEYLKIPYLYPKDIPWVTKSFLRSARIFENEERWDEAKVIYQKILNLNTDESKFAKERLEWIKENTFESASTLD